MTTYETAVTVLGVLLVGGALLSGVARRSILSLTAVFVLLGVALGDGGLGVLDFDPRSGFVEDLAPTAAQARPGDADHRRDHRRRRARPDRPHVDAGVPARRAALPHRPRAVLQRRDQPARAAHRPP